MNTEYNSPSAGKSFLPLTLISLSIIIFFVSQLIAISQARETLRVNKTKMDDAVAVNIPKLEDSEKKAAQVQEVVTKLANDLLELAKTDDNAAQVIKKYGIKQQTPPTAEGTPASATP